MATASAPPRGRARALASACATHMAQDGLSAAIYVLLPLLAQSFGLNYAQVGLFKTLKNLSEAVMQAGSGLVTERLGEARVMIASLCVAGAGYVALGTAETAGGVMACLLLLGVAGAFHHAPSSALIARVYSGGGRHGALGIYNSAGDVGKLAFAGAFGLLIGAGFAWQQAATLCGLAALAAAGAVVWGLRGYRRNVTAPSGQHTTPAAKGGNRRALALLLAAVFVDNAVQSGTLVFVSFLMIAKGLPLAVAAMASVAVLAGGIAGKAACGHLAARYGVARAFAAVQVLTALALLAVLAAPGWAGFALLAPLGVVAQGSTSISYGMVPGLTAPDRVARSYAMVYATASLASATGPLTLGLMADAWGLGTAIVTMAGLTLASTPAMTRLCATAGSGSPAA